MQLCQNNVLDYIVDKPKNLFHRTIWMKPLDFKSDSYAEYNVDSNEKKKDLEFKIGDHVRVSKCKNNFAKWYTSNWSEKVSIIRIKNTVPWIYAINNLKSEEIVGSF